MALLHVTEFQARFAADLYPVRGGDPDRQLNPMP